MSASDAAGYRVDAGPPHRDRVLHRIEPLTARCAGLVVVALATAAALTVPLMVPTVTAATVAFGLGVALAASGLHRPVLRPGTRFAGRHLLRVAVVLLGLQVALPDVLALGPAGLAVVLVTVAVTFLGTLGLAHVLHVPGPRGLLVATGFSICGASAVAGMTRTARADEDDAAAAIALVTLCGTTAILVLPAVREPLGLDPVAFGAWVGASVQDVGQTVATAQQVPGALSTAVVVKLSRVVLLAPLVAAVAVVAGLRTGDRHHSAGPAGVPAFVVGFLAAIVVGATGLVPTGVLSTAAGVQHVLTVAALVGLGTAVDLRGLRRGGLRLVLLGLGSWALVAGTALAGVHAAGWAVPEGP
jgi:uncharacterized integral membrane protein (TIGR00698 family)